MKIPLVKKAIQNLAKQDLKVRGLEREEILGELAKCLHRDIVGLQGGGKYIVTDLNQIPPELRAIIDGLEVYQNLDQEGNPVSQKIKIKISAKASAIDMAMKHAGLYAVEKHENLNKNVNLDITQLFTPLDPNKTDPVEQAILDVKGE
jgi:hypothetical protein